MYTRFPELVPPEIAANPTVDEVESGEWCYPFFRPDESHVTTLSPGLPIASQFARIMPKYLWLQNDRQAVVAVSSSHKHGLNDPFHEDVRSLYGRFVAETEGKERVIIREGRIWPLEALAGSDAEIIARGGDGLFLQSLAHRSGIECLSAEPVKDKDILAVMRLWPELRRAAVMYIKMRMLPQAYKNQQQNPPYVRSSILDYFRRFMDERQRYHGRSWTANHLYSINYFSGPGCLDAIGLHLTRVHGLRNDEGYALQGGEIAEGPREEVMDQIFRCTNSPVFHAGDIAYDELCEVQRVAVLVNRLRDRRKAYLLAHLGGKAVSYFDMSGHLHYEVMLSGLRGMAAERVLSNRNMHTELGLRAVQMSDMAATT